MTKIKELKSGSSQATPKGKNAPKAKSMTSVQLSRKPENRRKSLGAVLPSSKPQKKAKDFKLRRSIAAFPVPQFDEASDNLSGQNDQDHVESTPRKTKKSLAAHIPNPKVTLGGEKSTPINSIKKKKTQNHSPISDISQSIQENSIPLKSQNKKKSKKDSETSVTENGFEPNTTKRKQSLLIIKDTSSLQNGIKDQLTPLSKKVKAAKKTPLVLAPKVDSLESTFNNNSSQNEITKLQKIPLSKKAKASKGKPLILAPKVESPKIKQEAKSTANVLIKQMKKEAVDNKKAVLNISELEKEHDIDIKDVKNAIEGVIKFATNNPKLKNQLFNSEVPLFLQINSFKIPNTIGKTKHVFRVPMAHSILTGDSDICLIVPDVKGIPNKELERHQEHYEKFLADRGVKNIKKIMTFYEFRTEYETFELKNRLVDLYDIFLVDGKISGKVVHKGGHVFYKKRKLPNPIKLQASKLAENIENALKKVYFDMHVKSNSFIVQFGHSKMPTTQLIDNVYSVVQFLSKQFPGRMENIKNLNVYSHRGSSIPIYLSLKNPNDIKVPTIKHQKPKAYKSYTGELTTQYNADVVVRPSGKVIVRRTKGALENSGGDNEITEEDILRDSQQDKENKNKNKGKKRKNSENNVEVKLEIDVKSEGNNTKIKKEKTEVKVEEEINVFPKSKKNKQEGVKTHVNYNKVGKRSKNRKNKGKK